MTMQGFIDAHKVRMTAELIDSRPDGLMDDMPQGSNHWRCILWRGNRRMTIYFSQGPAISKEPTAADLLDCLASDYTTEDFESWASELGYETDSRKAERAYRACVKQSEQLVVLLGGSLETLLYHTER